MSKKALLFFTMNGSTNDDPSAVSCGCISGSVGQGGPQIPTTPATSPKRVMATPMTHLIARSHQRCNDNGRPSGVLLDPCPAREALRPPDFFFFLPREFGIAGS